MSNATNQATSLTLLNQMPQDFGLVTFSITDGFQAQTFLTVPYGGSVTHPTSTGSAPWTIAATLNGQGTTGPNVATQSIVCNDAGATITCALTVSSSSASSTPALAPLSPSDGFVAPCKRSLLDTDTGWNAIMDGPTPSAPKSSKLVFAMQAQKQDYWCWAALTSSVANYYNVLNPPSQCELANWAFGQVDCCVAEKGAVSPCNQPFDTPGALTHVGCLQAAGIKNSSLLFSRVSELIVAGRPIGIRISWGASVTHALAIVGYDCTEAAASTMDLKDPTFGETTVLFSGFPGNYHSALGWLASWETSAPAQ